MSHLDQLRTVLANERTVLAYIRTALAVIVSGLAAVKFFPEAPFFVFIGWTGVCAGILGLVFGFIRFRKIAKSIGNEK